MNKLPVICCLLALLSQTLPAKTLYWASHDCGGKGASYTTIIQDDVSGRITMIFMDCDGSTCVWPLGGVQIRIGGFIPPTRPDLRDLSRAAALLNDPGANVGVYMLDAETGDTLPFRNPRDEQERAGCMETWEKEMGGGIIITTPEQERYYTDLFVELTNQAYRAELVRQGRSNMLVSVEEGKLIIRPLDLAVADSVTLTDTDGVVVWSGYVAKAVTVELAPGDYILRGNEVMVPISVPFTIQ